MLIRSSVSTISSLLRSNCVNGPAMKNYSVWPSYYVEPVYEKPKLNELEKTGQKERLASVPVKAAKNENSCSVFHDPEIEKFACYVMRKGKKALARSLIEKTFENIKRTQLSKFYNETDEITRTKIILDPRIIFHQAVANCKPVLQLTPIKRGGATYQVPVPVSDKRAMFLSMNWLVQVSKDTPKPVHFPETLAKELIDAANNTGKIVKKKIDLHRQCEANLRYACPESDCNASYTRVDNLRRHQRLKHEYRWYICCICLKRFSRRGYLVGHLRAAHAIGDGLPGMLPRPRNNDFSRSHRNENLSQEERGGSDCLDKVSMS